MFQRLGKLSGALGLCLSVVVTLLAGGVLTPRTAHAATPNISFAIRGDTAFAAFESTDATGCIRTDVVVTGSDGLALFPPGEPQPVPGIGVVVSQFNLCTNILLLDAGGGAHGSNLQVAGDLSTATLTDPEVAMFDLLTGDMFFVAVNATWVGTGSITRQTFTSHFNTGGLVVNEVLVGFSRMAVATGTVTNGSTNYTPTPSSFGAVQNSPSSGMLCIHVASPCG